MKVNDLEEIKPCLFCGVRPSSGTKSEMGVFKCDNIACFVNQPVSCWDELTVNGFILALEAWNHRNPNKQKEVEVEK